MGIPNTPIKEASFLKIDKIIFDSRNTLPLLAYARFCLGKPIVSLMHDDTYLETVIAKKSFAERWKTYLVQKIESAHAF